MLLFHFGSGTSLPQTNPAGESKPEIRLEKISFLPRQIGATLSNIKVLETQVEVFNRSRKSPVSADSVKLVVSPK
jgi:hypothetical protein